MGRGPSSSARGADAPQSGLVLLGEFGRAHGLKGEVRLKSFTGDPLAITTYGPLTTGQGRSLTLTDARQAAGDQPDLLVARVEGVTTREAAEGLNRVRLYAPRDRLGEAEEDEFFLADLIGLRAEIAEGESLGTIVAVPNYGGGDLLEIAPPRGPTILVPFTKAFVPRVDIRAGQVLVAAAALELLSGSTDTEDGPANAVAEEPVPDR